MVKNPSFILLSLCYPSKMKANKGQGCSPADRGLLSSSEKSSAQPLQGVCVQPNQDHCGSVVRDLVCPGLPMLGARKAMKTTVLVLAITICPSSGCSSHFLLCLCFFFLIFKRIEISAPRNNLASVTRYEMKSFSTPLPIPPSAPLLL